MINTPMLSWRTGNDGYRCPKSWWNSTVLEIISFTTRSLYQGVPEKRQGAIPQFPASREICVQCLFKIQ
jgi:hypothetical protein